ncbi:hypothetical protein Q3G72_031600 [Acer saccharum]|nr:hypothetical protein Q3G72_031600 [Acer saccharum]
MGRQGDYKANTSHSRPNMDTFQGLLQPLHKWFPSLSNSYGVHGTNGEPGCIRYCVGFSIPSNDGNIPVSWSKERLIAVDQDQRSLSYEIVDNNIGFKSYVSTVKIVPGDHDDGGHENGCLIEWSFAVDPVEGMEFVDLVKKYDVGLQRMAKKMEDSLIQV